MSEAGAELLQDMARWRKQLACHLAQRNPWLTEVQLNRAVQHLLTRLIFLHLAVERGLEPAASLFDSSTRGDDQLLTVIIDDRVWRDLSLELDTPPISDRFHGLPIEFLGDAYEYFFGKVICLTVNYQAQLADEPRSKKANGVYYTPRYIVADIVTQTLSLALSDKSPAQLHDFRVLDPACGAGTFLLSAYRYLLNYYLAWYVNHNPQRQTLAVQYVNGEWRLTRAEKHRILTTHLFGVDTDQQAVEVTQLSLWLQLLESESVPAPLSFDLDHNFKCGNSLIGPDYTAGERAITSIDWPRDFPAATRAGGFDCIIGNPPYGADLTEAERTYLKRKHQARTTDTAAMMMLTATRLLKRGGLAGLIVPKPFTFSSNWSEIRTRLIPGLLALTDVGKVWKSVKLEQVIYLWQQGVIAPRYVSRQRKAETFHELARIDKQACLNFGFLINGLTSAEIALGKKISQAGAMLGDFVTNARGGMLQNQIGAAGAVRVIGGKQIQRYALVGEKGRLATADSLSPNTRVVPNSLLMQNIVAHVANPIAHIKITGTLAGASSRDIIILDTVNQLHNHSSMSSAYVLGVLLSRLMNWYMYRFIFAKAIRTMHFDGPATDRIPIRPIDLHNPIERSLHDELTRLVQHCLSLRADGQHIDQLVRVEAEIDQVVYQLYGLTADEIDLIQNQTV